MNQPIGYTRREITDLMMQNGIHCSVDRFMSLVAALQQRAIDEQAHEVENKEKV